MLYIDVNSPRGPVTTTVFPDGNGKENWVTIQDAAACPEPSTAAMAAFGLVLLGSPGRRAVTVGEGKPLVSGDSGIFAAVRVGYRF
jgi:hypothetical protein